MSVQTQSSTQRAQNQVAQTCEKKTYPEREASLRSWASRAPPESLSPSHRTSHSRQPRRGGGEGKPSDTSARARLTVLKPPGPQRGASCCMIVQMSSAKRHDKATENSWGSVKPRSIDPPPRCKSRLRIPNQHTCFRTSAWVSQVFPPSRITAHASGFDTAVTRGLISRCFALSRSSHSTQVSHFTHVPCSV